jgi:hypothetical protein
MAPDSPDLIPWQPVAAVLVVLLAGAAFAGAWWTSRRGKGVAPAAGDRRGLVRRDGEPVEVVLAAGPDGSQTLRGRVMDRSADGLGLQLPCEVPPGEGLAVRAAAAPDGTPWTAVRVKHCRPVDGDCWAIGCEFVPAPPQNTLPLFG